MNKKHHEINLVEGIDVLFASRKSILKTGTPAMDKILSTKLTGNYMREFDDENRNLNGGFTPGMLYLMAGPQKFLSTILMRVAVSAGLPFTMGGVNARKVLYVELNNHFDPYLVSELALSRGISPESIFNKMYIARGFNWEQSVELISHHVPSIVENDSVILISGITTWFKPNIARHHDNIKKMINGLKSCFQHENIYIIATAPLADGSNFKPRGGNNIIHFAGCVITVSQRITQSRSVITEYTLLQHPLIPQRTVIDWEHSKNNDVSLGIKAKREGQTRNQVLDEFLTKRVK
ncbi:MAG: hypothetical protein ACTSYS_16100 [Promethearchaeota archaeon]